MTLFDPKADSPLLDEELQGRKERYHQLPVETMAREAVLDVFGAYPESMESLEGGSNAMDHIVLAASVEKDRVHNVVIRLNTSSESEEQFLVEERLYALMRAAGVKAPWVYATHLRSERENHDYMIMERVGSSTLEAMPLHSKALATFRAGVYLAALHTLSVPKYGPLVCSPETDTLEGFYDSWKVAIESGVQDTLSYLVGEGLLSTESASNIRNIFSKHEKLLNTPDSVVLHGDYHPGNILLNAEEGTIAGAVDLSQAKSGDRVFDLAFFSTYEERGVTELIRGYKEHAVLPDDLDVRMNLYRLRILMSKAKLRKRFGYVERIPQALRGIEDAARNLV